MYFNILTYSEDGKIKLKLENIFPREPKHSEFYMNTAPQKISIKSLENINFQEEETLVYPVFIDDEVNPQSIKSLSFEAKDEDDGKAQPYIREAFIYELPKDPDLALNFIATIDRFESHCSNVAIERNQSIDDFITSNQLNMSLGDFFDCATYIDSCDGNNNHLQKLHRDFVDSHQIINAILALPPIPQYQASIDALKSIYDYCKNEYFASKMPRDFHACLRNTRLRELILSHHSPYLLIDPDVPEQKKLDLLSGIKNDYNHEITSFKWLQTIKAVNHLAILQLISPCIGKLAADGGKYNNHYTELDLLINAEFCLRADGRMSIINLNKNVGYCKYYAPGAQNNAIFEKEMRFLGKVIGLKFATDCDFHKEIIFTESCTQQLKAKGLHFNENFLIRLLSPPSGMRNAQHLFFKPAFDLEEMLEEQADEFGAARCAIL